LQIEQFLERSAVRFPDKTALVCGTERLTYAEISQMANRLANALIARGVRRGDRVAVCLDSCSEAVISIFAILKAGAIFTVLDHTIKSDGLRHIVNDCSATSLVISADKLRDVEVALEQAPCLGSVCVAGVSADLPEHQRLRFFSFDQTIKGSEFGADAPRKQCMDSDLAALIYTSGTTGRPKGVMLTHLNMFAASESVISYLENDPSDVILNVLRLSYSYGLYQVLTGFSVGGTVILERSLAYPYLLLDLIKRERVTAFPLVPTIAAMLLQFDLNRHDLSSLRYITSAGAALPVSHAQLLRKWLPRARLFIMYGQTECKRISYLPPEQLDSRPNSVGIAIPNEEVFIVDEAGHPVGPGVVGELVVRGPHVMQGYWGLPEETARALRPGPVRGERVLYTGDLFTMDEEGYLYFVARKDDIIKTRGEKVSPREIEDVLSAIEGLLEVAVVGVPDDVFGHSIKAVVTLRDGFSISAQEIQRHCAMHLEDFKVPRYVEFRTSLPKTDRGKIDRREIRHPLEARA